VHVLTSSSTAPRVCAPNCSASLSLLIGVAGCIVIAIATIIVVFAIVSFLDISNSTLCRSDTDLHHPSPRALHQQTRTPTVTHHTSSPLEHRHLSITPTLSLPLSLPHGRRRLGSPRRRPVRAPRRLQRPRRRLPRVPAHIQRLQPRPPQAPAPKLWQEKLIPRQPVG
jgi:hypothetical protein